MILSFNQIIRRIIQFRIQYWNQLISRSPSVATDLLALSPCCPPVRPSIPPSFGCLPLYRSCICIICPHSPPLAFRSPPPLLFRISTFSFYILCQLAIHPHSFSAGIPVISSRFVLVFDLRQAPIWPYSGLHRCHPSLRNQLSGSCERSSKVQPTQSRVDSLLINRVDPLLINRVDLLLINRVDPLLINRVLSSGDQHSWSASDQQRWSSADQKSWSSAYQQSWFSADQQSLSSANQKSWSSADQQSWSSADQKSWSSTDQKSWSSADQQSWSSADQKSWSSTDQKSWSSADQQSWSSADQKSWSSADQQSWFSGDQQSWSSGDQQSWSSADQRSWFSGDKLSVDIRSVFGYNIWTSVSYLKSQPNDGC